MSDHLGRFGASGDDMYVRRWDCDGCTPENCPGCVLPFDVRGALTDVLVAYDVPTKQITEEFLTLANHSDYRGR